MSEDAKYQVALYFTALNDPKRAKLFYTDVPISKAFGEIFITSVYFKNYSNIDWYLRFASGVDWDAFDVVLDKMIAEKHPIYKLMMYWHDNTPYDCITDQEYEYQLKLLNEHRKKYWTKTDQTPLFYDRGRGPRRPLSDFI